MSDGTRVVCHRVGQWLPPTQTWLYGQIVGLPAPWRSIVVADSRKPGTNPPLEGVIIIGGTDSGPILLRQTRRLINQLRRDARSRRVARVAAAEHPVVLHSHFGHTGWAALPLARALGVPHVVTFYGQDLTKLPRRARWRRRYREMFGAVDKVLAEGPHMASVIAELGCPRAKIDVHSLGVDMDRIRHRHLEWRQGEVLRVLLAGRFKEKKGFPYALQALGLLRARRPELPIAVTIVGATGGQPAAEAELQRMRTITASAGLDGCTTWAGSLEHEALLALADSHHFFMSPSVTAVDGDTEGGAPVSIIEFAAAGLPVIATTHCDIPFVVAEPNRSLLVGERNAEALCSSMLTLLDTPGLWRSISESNRQRTEAYFDRVRQSHALAQCYESLSSGLTRDTAEWSA